MKIIKRTKEQDDRLKKLIRFLSKLPKEKFYFGAVIESWDAKKSCGTVCCAAGWLPHLFPDKVKWAEKVFTDDGVWHTIARASDPSRSIKDRWTQTVQDVLGVPCVLLSPWQQYQVDRRLALLPSNATPAEVADMIRHYRKLHPVQP